MKAITLIFLAALLSGCTQLFFQPHSYLIDRPDRHGLTYQSEFFRAADGTTLNAWFLPAQNTPIAKASILYLHGNAENISTHFRSIAWLTGKGFNVLALDYRGYGASAGKPSLDGAQLDIDAAMRHLMTHKNVDPAKIAIFGQSLGAAFATYYAAHSAYKSNISAVIIDSAFADYRQIAREKLASSYITWLFQWLPWLVINNDYAPADSIAMISPIPLLILHGDHDEVVPYHHSEQLFQLAREPKQLWIEPNARHTQSLASKTVREKLIEFLMRYTETRQQHP